MNYIEKIQKIIGDVADNKGWRYRHAKNFEHALELFADFVLLKLHALNEESISIVATETVLDITPDIQDKLLVTIRHFILKLKQTLEYLVQEFATLLDMYKVAIPLNDAGYKSLKIVLKKHEQKIETEINKIHNSVFTLKQRAKYTQLFTTMAYKKLIPILNEILKFDLKSLDLMFQTGNIPKIFTMVNYDD